jgi:hypothetical protein
MSSISNIQFTDLILSDKFEEYLRQIEGVCDGERNSLYHELSEVKLVTMKENT